MAHSVSLAWAINLQYTQLGARLEAYVEIKAAITTLKACVLHTDSPAMSKVPLELIDSMADNLKDLIYNSRIQQ